MPRTEVSFAELGVRNGKDVPTPLVYDGSMWDLLAVDEIERIAIYGREEVFELNRGAVDVLIAAEIAAAAAVEAAVAEVLLARERSETHIEVDAELMLELEHRGITLDEDAVSSVNEEPDLE